MIALLALSSSPLLYRLLLGNLNNLRFAIVQTRTIPVIVVGVSSGTCADPNPGSLCALYAPGFEGKGEQKDKYYQDSLNHCPSHFRLPLSPRPQPPHSFG